MYVLISVYHFNDQTRSHPENFFAGQTFSSPARLFDMIPPLLTWLILLCSIDHTSTIVRDIIKEE